MARLAASGGGSGSSLQSRAGASNARMLFSPPGDSGYKREKNNLSPFYKREKNNLSPFYVPVLRFTVLEKNNLSPFYRFMSPF